MKRLGSRTDDEILRGRRAAEEAIIAMTGTETEDDISALLENNGAEITRNPAFSRGYTELMAEYQWHTPKDRAELMHRLSSQKQIRDMSAELSRRKLLPKSGKSSLGGRHTSRHPR